MNVLGLSLGLCKVTFLLFLIICFMICYIMHCEVAYTVHNAHSAHNF